MQIFAFDESVRNELENTVNALVSAQVSGIVWDVRNTAGGDPLVALAVLDRLLPEGVMAKTVDHKGEKKELKSDETCLDLPMTVLINSSTSFGGELFAAVLKDFGKATLIGETTYGKSQEQKVFELDNGSALLLSVMAYQPPKSPSFESVGVEPDISVKLSGENLYLLAHDNDPQLAEARRVLSGN